MTIKANTPVDHATLARERTEAARLVDLAVQHMERAAVTLAGAIDHVQKADMRTPGCRRVLQASIDVLRDQIEIDGAEHQALLKEAAQANRAVAATEGEAA